MHNYRKNNEKHRRWTSFFSSGISVFLLYFFCYCILSDVAFLHFSVFPFGAFLLLFLLLLCNSAFLCFFVFSSGLFYSDWCSPRTPQALQKLFYEVAQGFLTKQCEARVICKRFPQDSRRRLEYVAKVCQHEHLFVLSECLKKPSSGPPGVSCNSCHQRYHCTNVSEQCLKKMLCKKRNEAECLAIVILEERLTAARAQGRAMIPLSSWPGKAKNFAKPCKTCLRAYNSPRKRQKQCPGEFQGKAGWEEIVHMFLKACRWRRIGNSKCKDLIYEVELAALVPLERRETLRKAFRS